MTKVNLSDGTVLNFPDSMSQDQIKAVLRQKFPAQQAQKPPMSQSQALLDQVLNSQNQTAMGGYKNPGIEAMEKVPYLAQGAINEPIKMLNVLKKNKLPTLDIARKIAPGLESEEAKGVESFGGILGMGLPRAGTSLAARGALQIPKIGNVLKRAAETSPLLNKILDVGSRGGEFGLYEAAEHPEQAGTRGALGFGLGAGLSGLGYGIPAIANKLGFGKVPGAETIEGLTYGQVAPQVEAAQRLGTPLRPSEATGNPFIAGMEGRYPRTREAAALNVEKGMERIGQEKQVINKFLDAIYDKSATSNAKVRNLYTSAYQWNMKPEVVNKLKQDPLINDAFERVASDKVWQRKMEGKPENSFAYLDKVRKELGDQENKLIKAGEKSKAAEYTDARNSLTNIMDSSLDVYKKARQEAQKSIVRSNLEKTLKKGEIKGTEFYKKVIKNENEYNKLYSSLGNAPEAQKMLSDMKTAWSNLINVEKPSSASYQSEKALNQARNWLETVIETKNNLLGKKKNAEAIKFIRSDAWVKQLRNAQKSGDKDAIEKTANDIMMKVLPIGDFLLEENK